MAPPVGVEDRYQHGRGVALADFNADGKTDIVYGNWNGQHRLYLQDNNQRFRVREGMEGEREGGWRGVGVEAGWEREVSVTDQREVNGMGGRLGRDGNKDIKPLCSLPPQDIASGSFSSPSPVRTVIAADFDNDQELDIFFNNIAYRGHAPNRLFRYL